WLYVAELFPEFTAAANWQTRARQLLFDAMDGQLYDDGSHREQSPGYTQSIIEDLLETKLLETRNGVTWPADRDTKLDNAINSYYQFLTPDGNRPAIGDTYRSFALPGFLNADLVQGVTTWPTFNTPAHDAGLF